MVALVVLVVAALVIQVNALKNMQLQYTWGPIRFAFESEQQREELLAREDFAPQNSTIFDVDVDDSGRVFVSLPAFLPGYPATLATIKDPKQKDSPELKPYPDWSWHLGQRGCEGLTSVFRIYIECNHLWVIDSGVVDISGSFTHRCPPQLLLFDLRSDRLLLRHALRVPAAFADGALPLQVVAERPHGCRGDAFAYVADPGSFALYVFNLRSRRSWRVESDALRPDGDATQFLVDGTAFSVEDGVLALAQDPVHLYFHAFSSFREGRVRKSVLRDERRYRDAANASAARFEIIGSRAAQSAGEAMSDGVMFFGEMGTNSIYCWNTDTQYKTENHHVVERDDDRLHFVASVKVKREEVWAVDNNGQRLFAGEFQPNEPNTINIVKGPAATLASKCRSRIWLLPG